MLLTSKWGVVLGCFLQLGRKGHQGRWSPPSLHLPTPTALGGKWKVTEGWVTPWSASLLTTPAGLPTPVHPTSMPSFFTGPMKGWPLDPFTLLSSEGEGNPTCWTCSKRRAH